MPAVWRWMAVTEFVQLHTGLTLMAPPWTMEEREAIRAALALWNTLLAIAETDGRVLHNPTGPCLWIYWIVQF